MARPGHPAHELSDLLPRFDVRGMDLSLDRMMNALEQLQRPAQSIPAVQVVGTNGKGSIACLIHHGLMAAGLRSGLTTSPHLVSWCERIRINDQLIAITDLRQRLEQLRPVTDQCRLTPFEQLICTALLHFESRKPDWLVLEAGLGGRLDATTAHSLRPLIAVASIGMDHREHLGPNLQAIAAEKAAAIGEGAHVISATQKPEVSVVLEQQVQKMNGTLQWVDALDESWTLGLSGAFQKRNGAVAEAALQWMSTRSEPISNQAIRSGFAAARWPGRLQWMRWRGRTGAAGMAWHGMAWRAADCWAYLLAILSLFPLSVSLLSRGRRGAAAGKKRHGQGEESDKPPSLNSGCFSKCGSTSTAWVMVCSCAAATAAVLSRPGSWAIMSCLLFDALKERRGREGRQRRRSE